MRCSGYLESFDRSIIAVHGLNGHRDKTWTASNGVNWLRDLLPQALPNARIITWGYDANTHSGARVSCQYLYDHARSLVADLCLERQLTEALIHSDTARREALEEHRSIKLSTYGIIFMGTPHQGGSGVALGKLMVNIASLFMAADDRLLQHLERDSEWLQQQLGQYGPISGDFVTKFAFEEYATPTVLGQSIMPTRLSPARPRSCQELPMPSRLSYLLITSTWLNLIRSRTQDIGRCLATCG
ncbi:hypothetical protein K469DRAFT_728118 [Zopfia rhizophila CBS 207.26]|uniref:DUF676 domain-containing protein n=1 Tax=Zopfia rhizophila CBS 207.26 TaxID=1314779 RepID=A0A6A6DWK6_9PEZI|nr:hypothetical protein K469DRAFT_728118 [Zopfia rhizophila CBS 207.26]